MSITYIDGTARGPTGKVEPIPFLVDRGATYSLLPTPVWESLGPEPTREQTFTLAGGTNTQRRISTGYLILPRGDDYSPINLGQAGDEALLGVVTLKIMRFIFHPFSRTLYPMPMMLA